MTTDGLIVLAAWLEWFALVAGLAWLALGRRPG